MADSSNEGAASPSPLKEAARRWAPPLLGLGVLAAALAALRHELKHVGYHQLSAEFSALPASRIVLAIALTALNYLILTGYDQLAFAYLGKQIGHAKVAFASFIAYAVANNLGLGMISGASVRYRFYTRWGLDAAELSRVVLFYSSTFWLGLLLLGGVCLATGQLDAFQLGVFSAFPRALGVAMAAACIAYLVLSVVRSRPLAVRSFELTVPRPPIAFGQVLLSSLDWTLAAAVLHALLPPDRVPFAAVFTAFIAAQLLGIVSHVPGGVGVFESTVVVLLRSRISASELVPVLMVFRAVYYWLPLATALALLGGDELRVRRAHVARARAVLGALTAEVTPRILAVFTFLAGAVLLFSGATPAAHGRLDALTKLVPLGVLETSHFVGSIMGVALLVLSQGIARRLDASLYLAVVALGVGAIASILKGADWEEAVIVSLVLGALLESRRRFDRRAAFFASRFSVGWLAATLAVLGSSIWLGFFSFKHQEYSNELWWQFEIEQEASRFLRATVGASVLLLAIGARRLLRPAAPEVELASEDDLNAAASVIANDASSSSALALLGDKSLLFNAARRAFVMYGVQGRTWVALGDPAGPADEAPGLIREFLERCDDYDGNPVFYEVSKERLHHYADFGLTFVKLGEEALIPLDTFELASPAAKQHRNTLRRLEKEGATFRVAPREEVPALLDALREVSDDWLAHKQVAEKGFSLGFFDPHYLSRFPMALIERGGRVEAFANLWAAPAGGELSVDLMRFRESAPKLAMDALFVHLMVWGKANGFTRFNLGMAPLSGLETSAIAPLWTKVGLFLFRHGESFYNFQGLRAYKEKYAPIWEPRYFAYPGGLALPRIMADVSALVAGGYRRIFMR